MPDDKDKHATHTPAHAAQATAHRGPAPAAPARTGLGGRPASPEAAPQTQVDPGVVAAAIAGATAAMEQRRIASAATPNMDRTVPGGLYIVDGKFVDAEGREREKPEEGGEGGDAPPAGGAG